MSTLLIFLWISFACVAAATFYWAFVLFRMLRALSDRPSVRRGLDLSIPSEGLPKVSVVIPAHNEERVVDACATSIRSQQYEDLEIIFALDRCTDRTAEILKKHAAEDDRIKLVEIESCPSDWAGKCHAAHQGSQHATGEWILFTDADTSFDPNLIRASVLMAKDRDASLLSLLSTLTTHHDFERSAQPVASMTLLKLFPLDRVNDQRNGRVFANGQFLLFDRKFYESIQGHVSVKDALLEDLAFAERVYVRGGRGLLLLADGMLICSMYSSLENFREGWKRIFIEACHRRPSRLRKQAVRVAALGVVLPAICLVLLILGIMALLLGDQTTGIIGLAMILACAVVQLTAMMMIYRAGCVSWRYIWLYPYGAWIVMRILQQGANDLLTRQPIRWAGREYILDPR